MLRVILMYIGSLGWILSGVCYWINGEPFLEYGLCFILAYQSMALANIWERDL